MAQNPQLTSPLLNQFQYTYEKDSVTIFGRCHINDDFGRVTNPSGLGIQSIDRTDPALFASFSGQVAGMTTDVLIEADLPGAAGNVTITGDGSSTVDDLIDAWNVANPSNTITLSDGDGSQIPDNLVDITLSGGSDGTPGEYTVILQDVFNKLMESHAVTVLDTPTNICYIQMLLSPASMQSNVRNGASRTLIMQCYNYAGAAAWPPHNCDLYFRLVLRNSSLNAPTG